MRTAALAAVTLAAMSLATGLAACGGTGRDQRATRPADHVLIDAEPAEVARLEVSSGEHAVRFARAGPRWVPDGAIPAAATALRSVERSLLPLQAYRTFTVDELDPFFGLEDPALVLHVQGVGGRSWSLEVGAATPTGGGYYARRPGSGEISILTRASFLALLALVPDGAALAPPPAEDDPAPPPPEPDSGTNPWLRQARAASTGKGEP